jgi:hypothetical protein
MKKTTTLVLMLCLILSGALCYAHSEARTKVKEDGIPIGIKESTGSMSGTDKSGSIIPTIVDHTLTIIFSENIGVVYAEVITDANAPVDAALTITPNSIQFFIPNAGNYIINFTLSNGDEYYGEFMVMD